ncbi:BRO1 domain-containing protein [Drosera capensis]
MGCSTSLLRRNKKMAAVPEVIVFVPALQVPSASELQRALQGLVPPSLIERLTAVRDRITLVAECTNGSAVTELKHALEEYLPLLLGLTKKEFGLDELVDFKWKYLGDKRKETCISSSWFELLSVIYMLGLLTLSEANSLLIPNEHSASEDGAISGDSTKNAVDLLLKASGYLEFCARSILANLSSEIKKKVPRDMQEGILEALCIQALGQATELQLGVAIESQMATLSVKRRLACEQLTYFSQAHHQLTASKIGEDGAIKKHSLFIRWKYLEAKAAAYYFHGMVLDKAKAPSSHVSAMRCFLAAEELISESKKACLSFCLAKPVNRIPPVRSTMRHLNHQLPEIISRKSTVYGNKLEQDKGSHELPDLPEFELSLRPDDYELPATSTVWNRDDWEILGQPLKNYLEDSEDEGKTS